MRKKIVYFFTTLSLLFIFVAKVNAQLPQDVTIHGFGGWAYGITDNENRYILGNEDGNFDNVNFALNISANPYEDLRLHFQSSFHENFDKRKVRLDYAFAEWFLSDRITFRIGQVKTPSMLYTEIYNVGTLRPFYTLPQGVYHHLATESYKGFGFTGNFYSGHGWEILYDFYLGKIDLHPVRGAFFETKNDSLNVEFSDADWYLENVIGGRWSIGVPIDGLTVMLSSYSGDINTVVKGVAMDIESDERYEFNGISVEYLRDRLWIRAEALENRENDIEFTTGYLELAYKFTEHWQLAGRYDFEDIEKDIGKTNEYVPGEDMKSDFNEHDEFALGINYWFNPSLVLKFSIHRARGNIFAFPDNLGRYLKNYANEEFLDKTTLLILGTQFSF